MLACADLAKDERFATNPKRVAHRATLIPLLEERFRTQSAAFWQERLTAANVPCSPVNDIPTALADPQAVARQMVQTIEHPVTGRIPLLGPVPKMSGTPAEIRSAPPLLGEHTDTVLRELLGYSVEQVELLRKGGAI